MGATLSSIFSINSCSCGSSNVEDIQQIGENVVELTNNIIELKERVDSIVMNTATADAQIAKLAAITKKMDSNIASLYTTIFDRLLTGYKTPDPPRTPRVSFSDGV